jgi:hypothetical protein
MKAITSSGCRLLFTVTLVIIFSGQVEANTIFTDDFEPDASELWDGTCGAWVASGGVYYAQSPGNYPSSHSILPFVLQDFDIEVDINNASDGGIWLRSFADWDKPLAIKGVLLVMHDTDLYWHVVEEGEGYGPGLNLVNNVFNEGDNIHICVSVRDNIYSAFLNGSETPATTLIADLFPSGHVALYDCSSQTFDNVILNTPDPVPEPTSLALLAAGALGLLGYGWKRRRRR